ncbi:nuclear transport factor 2 family protein [Sphingobium subterraneum]|uniref:SnoaL-like domain-containing protein n=1 Tax=Sphingobium subterraneum TaxID=627688 RepID=A0A841J199_9SPHN|nr:nuclear transport factor 2 family protein [Sphingobium subterraneum]MBB6122298.1 hypothetical protein [Sphingobium subterraneum]
MTTADRNRALIEDIFAQWAAGLSSFFDLLADEAVCTISGTTPHAGTYNGRDQFLRDIVTPFMSRLKGPIVPTLHKIIAQGDEVAILWSGRAPLQNGETYSNNYAFFSTLQSGRVVRLTTVLDMSAFERVWTDFAEVA